MEDNKDQKEDVRIIRTKRDLVNALQELLKEKPFDDIQIQEITDRALVSKHTFYNNFKDKNELLNFLFNRYKDQLLIQVRPLLEKYRHGTQLIFFRKTIETVVHFFYTTNLPLQQLISNDTSGTFFRNMNTFCQSVLAQLDSEYHYFLTDRINTTVSTYFYGGALSSTLYFSYLKGVPVSEKTMVKDICRLTFPAVIE